MASTFAPSAPAEVVTSSESAARRRISARRYQRRLGTAALHLLFVASVVGLWQLASGRWVDPLLISRPSDVAIRLGEWATDGFLTHHLSFTLRALFTGFAGGVLAALVVAVLLTEVRSLGRFFEPYIMALSAIPFPALAPLLIVWLGLGISTKVVMALLTTFFVVFVNLHTGLKQTDAHLLELSRILRASRIQRLLKVKLWSALPYLLSGIKLALPRALIAVVVAEFVASNRGVGYVMIRGGNLLDMPAVFAAVIVLAALVQGLTLVLTAVERRLLAWKPQERR